MGIEIPLPLRFIKCLHRSLVYQNLDNAWLRDYLYSLTHVGGQASISGDLKHLLIDFDDLDDFQKQMVILSRLGKEV